MIQSIRVLLGIIVIGVISTLSGCGSPTSQENQKTTTPGGSKSEEKNAAQGERSVNRAYTPSADAIKGLAELSDDDRIIAEKQRVCPVSGEELGTMDKPYKITVKSQSVFLCCKACEKELLENPDKYLAKINADLAK